MLHRLRGLFDQVGAVVIGDHLNVRWQHALVQLPGQILYAVEHYLRLLSRAHQDDAFHGFRLSHISKLAETHGVADLYLGHIAHVNRNPVVYREDDISYVGRIPYQPQAANIIGLPALRIEAAARVRVVPTELLHNLGQRYSVSVELVRIEQDLVLHGGAAEPGIVRHALNPAIGAFQYPILDRLQLL